MFQEISRRIISASAPELCRTFVPVFKIPFCQREPFLAFSAFGFARENRLSKSITPSFAISPKKVLPYPNLFVHELDVVNDERAVCLR